MSSEHNGSVGQPSAAVDRDACIGSGNCVEVAPNAFVLDDDGMANYLGGGNDSDINAASSSCPVAAISRS